MIIVSFATDDGKYTGYLDRLRDACRAHGLNCDFQVIPPTSRLEACLKKPSFIREMLARHNQPVLWLDADAIVTKPFSLPSGAWDIGVIPNTSFWRRRRNPTSAFVLAAAPTDSACSFLDAWAHLCRWSGLSLRTDHGRLTWTRQIRAGTYREINMSGWLRGAIIRDYGLRKQKMI